MSVRRSNATGCWMAMRSTHAFFEFGAAGVDGVVFADHLARHFEVAVFQSAYRLGYRLLHHAAEREQAILQLLQRVIELGPRSWVEHNRTPS